ncbi:hypothetical protein SAMN05421769_0512 [Chryseobacterium scophthalmum]|uniref:Uncharacterized protein n=1 Tax=Chryseobacterium scophthalmum TaxID=59733 RepID=A0A1N6EMA4_9FLAO|nr:hypothetical protein SAMN05421769_0512 [Chryseobacterium scophthalmum]
MDNRVYVNFNKETKVVATLMTFKNLAFITLF